MKKEGRWGRIICTLINHASLCYLNVSSRLIETLTSVSIKKKSFKFARPWIFTTVCWIMQGSVNYSSLVDRDGGALKSMQKRDYGVWCCVNTFHSGLLTRHIFVSTLILFFNIYIYMFASNKVPVTDPFLLACFSLWLCMAAVGNDVRLYIPQISTTISVVERPSAFQGMLKAGAQHELEFTVDGNKQGLK